MNRTFFRRRRRLVLGLAFAALALPATGQAASGLYVDGPTPGIYSHTDSQQALIDRHHALGNLSVSSKVDLGPVDPWAYSLLHKSTSQPAVDTSMSRSIDLGPVDPWAFSLIHKTVEPTITPLQADGMRLNAIAQAYKESVASKTAAQPAKAVQSAASTSFNWSDAGVGASIAFGVALLLTLSVAIGRRRHTRTDRTGLASA